MKNLYITILIAVITSNLLYPQCSTYRFENDPDPVYFGKQELLNEIDELVQSYKSRSDMSRTDPSYVENAALINVPLKIWAYYKDESDLQNGRSYIESRIPIVRDYLNQLFLPASISFYIKCEIEHVIDDRFDSNNLDLPNGDPDSGQNRSQDLLMKTTYHDEKALNMHIPTNGANFGYGEFPWKSLNATFSVGSISNSNLDHVAHEVGHAMGLYHTFESKRGGTDNGAEGKCYQESVMRHRENKITEGCVSTIGKKKCSENGDGFCDTEADYYASSDFFNYSTRLYTGNREDNWHDRYVPPVQNIMSYFPYRVLFSAQQYSTMIMYLNLTYHPLTGHNYFADNNISFLNLNNIKVSGQVNSNESEKYVVPESIISGNSLLVENGGQLDLHTQREISLTDGVHVENGAWFSAKTEPISDCDEVFFPENNSFAKGIRGVAQVKYESKFQKELADIIDKHLTTENTLHLSEEYNTSKEIKIYPTVLDDKRTIYISYELNHEESIQDVSIYNMSGSKVFSIDVLKLKSDTTGTGDYSFQLNDLPVGKYIMKLTTSENNITSRFVIFE